MASRKKPKKQGPRANLVVLLDFREQREKERRELAPDAFKAQFDVKRKKIFDWLFGRRVYDLMYSSDPRVLDMLDQICKEIDSL